MLATQEDWEEEEVVGGGPSGEAKVGAMEEFFEGGNGDAREENFKGGRGKANCRKGNLRVEMVV